MFGKRLKELRKEKNLSQLALANALGLERSTIMKWETGVSETNFAMLCKIADFFDVSTDYLLGRSDY